MNRSAYYRGKERGYSGNKLSPIQEMFVRMGESGINTYFFEGYKDGVVQRFREEIEEFSF